MKKLKAQQVIAGSKFLSAMDLLGIALILSVASFMQFAYGELPCPLCLLQRLGMTAIGFGFLLNVRYHVRTSHYALSLLAAVFTAFVAMRQVLLHIVPGTGSYGSAIFGLHMYTWVFVMSIVAIIYIAMVMSGPAQYVLSNTHKEDRDELRAPWAKHFAHFAFVVFFAMTLFNIVSIVHECGFQECPDNPVGNVI